MGRRAGREGFAGRSGGLKALEEVERAMVGALGGIDAALEAGKGVGGMAESVAEGAFFSKPVPTLGVEEFRLPELGLDFAEAAEEPVGMDEGIDELALFGGSRAEALVVLDGEVFKDGGVLAANDGGLSVDAGFEGIEAGDGLALDGAGAG